MPANCKPQTDSLDLSVPGAGARKHCEETRFPVGNGRLGAMPAGGIGRESVQFNVDTLWTGGENLSGAAALKESAATDATVGDYQNFGEVEVVFDIPRAASAAPPPNAFVREYSRKLDLKRAVHTVEFNLGGTNRVVREIFASHPADVVAMRFRAEHPFSARIKLKGAHGEKTGSLADGRSLEFGGALSNGLHYAARLDVPFAGVARGDGCVEVAQTRELVVYLRAKTAFDPARGDFGLGMPCERYADVFGRDFDELLEEHIRDYSPIYNRVKLVLPDETIARLFNFGRYLLISSSRPGTAPANLQGIWNASNRPAWHSDYHTNINLQMNYWGVDVANLSEMAEPVADYLLWAGRTAKKEARLAFPASRGVAYRTSLNLFGGGGWRWNMAGAPWMAIMAFDHYLFTLDEPYLREKAWPLLRDAALFALDNLVEGSAGELLVKDGWSPEHGPVADGVAHDQQIVRELFMDVLSAHDVLRLAGEEDFVRRVSDALGRLGGDKIGSWGQLQEWYEDMDRPGDDHRHTSHLFAVYPGKTITRAGTPYLARAAEISLRGRALTGDARRSWTWPWRTALWARLGNGAEAGKMLENLVQYNLLPNYFTTHPPFQIDGNLGLVGAVCEMLVQSHETTPDGKTLVRLLPALPPSWPNGEVRGLKLRGGGEISIVWRDGKVVDWKITGRTRPCEVKIDK